MILWALVTWQGVYALDEGPYSKPRKFELPQREISIIVTEEGFYPQKISVFKGEKVRFFVTSTTDSKNCFILKGKDLFLSAEKGKISEGTLLFDRKESVEFYCPTSIEKGRLTVLERPQDVKKERAQRTIASERVKIWMPREE
ncbi:MAG: hypothetical protein VXV96_04125 [Bdellovibrionota bacterium]|nr:hypothetical protein [Bdellovibrionota bacterium]